MSWCDWLRQKALAAGFIQRPKASFDLEVAAARVKLDQPIRPTHERAIFQNRSQAFLGTSQVAMPSLLTSDMRLRQHDRADWSGVHPFLREFAGRFIVHFEKMGVPLYCHTALRSKAEQLRLHKSGRSQLVDGPHTRGAAVDIVHSHYHWELTDNEWLHLGIEGQRIVDTMNASRPSSDRNDLKRKFQVQWGGDWDGDGQITLQDPDESFWDPAHWQLREWRSMPSVSTGSLLKLTPKALILDST